MKRSFALVGIVLVICGCALSPDPVVYTPQPQTQAVVFDIDGTLTPDVMAVFSVRPKAAEAAHLFSEKGYTLIYLSARVKLLQSNIPGWLEKHGFPPGAVHVTETKEDRADHAAFKARVLKEYIEQGWALRYAYGDSSTDFEAYNTVGIPKENIYALQRKGDEQCQPGIWNACLTSWSEHLNFIRDDIPPADSDM